MNMSEHFAFRLRELRKAAGLTQPELAERAGVSAKAIANLEQGIREPAWSSVLALAGALGVDCSAFQQPPTNVIPTGRGRPAKSEASSEQLERAETAVAKPIKKKGKRTK